MVLKVTVEQKVCARIPTAYGEFNLCLYTNNQDSKEHMAAVLGNVKAQENVLARVHSECFTGDVFGSQRCDCGDQMHRSLAMISQEGRGVLVYLRQEGRGIGLLEKLRAYNLQDEGYDTVDANLALGHQADSRDYTIAAEILADLGVRSVRLLTNNPDKIGRLQSLGVKLVERVEIPPTVTPDNEKYLRTKKDRMNHLFNLPSLSSDKDNGTG